MTRPVLSPGDFLEMSSTQPLEAEHTPRVKWKNLLLQVETQ